MADLTAQRQRLDGAVEDAIAAVLRHGQFIMGPEVREFEGRLELAVGVANVVTCGTGTDALVLALRALGIAPGSAIYVPAFTFAATAEAAALCGATPVMVDVLPDTFNMSPDSLSEAVE